MNLVRGEREREREMAVSSSCARVFPTFECRSDPEYPGNTRPEYLNSGRFHAGKSTSSKPFSVSFGGSPGGLSSLIFKFPPNFVRQLSTKSRRNCSNIGVAQVVAASWSTNPSASVPPPTAAAVDAPPIEIIDGEPTVINGGVNPPCNINSVQLPSLIDSKTTSFLTSDGSIAIHAGIDPIFNLLYLFIYIYIYLYNIIEILSFFFPVVAKWWPELCGSYKNEVFGRSVDHWQKLVCCNWGQKGFNCFYDESSVSLLEGSILMVVLDNLSSLTWTTAIRGVFVIICFLLFPFVLLVSFRLFL